MPLSDIHLDAWRASLATHAAVVTRAGKRWPPKRFRRWRGTTSCVRSAARPSLGAH
jgi:hypothetical protein